MPRGRTSSKDSAEAQGFNYDGTWGIVCPQPWLHNLTISGDKVVDGLGEAIRLKRRDHDVYLEGGKLSYMSDFVCRTGKSGIIQYWAREYSADEPVRQGTAASSQGGTGFRKK
mmetsp:Transcript_91400/g.258166  ORF Transcript_91400/g.258166 Transcript_91400/m.258166 type:complete len:113 (+) Transcript_91400:2-340(+)